MDPNVGVVAVPDQRLEKLAKIVGASKIIPTTIEFVDIAGLVKGASHGEGLGNQFLSHIREADAILEVVRIFENDKIVHVDGKVDPVKDIEVLETELILADLETLEKRAQKLEKEVKGQNQEAVAQLAVVKKIKSGLEKGSLARAISLSQDELALVSDLSLLTFKPIFYLFNSTEKQEEIAPELKKKHQVIADLKLEEEIMDLSPNERKELKVASNLDRVIVEAYQLLDLITFFTFNEQEARAWTVKRGATAPAAGGVIHTDFQKNFIRAEIINWLTLEKAGSYQTAHEKGLIKTEGKDYLVQDGDIIKIKV